MASETERRREQIEAIAGDPYAVEVSPVSAWRRLLAHFEVTDQKPLADAIRYGLREVKTEDSWLFHPKTGEGLQLVADEVELFIIDRPEWR